MLKIKLTRDPSADGEIGGYQGVAVDAVFDSVSDVQGRAGQGRHPLHANLRPEL
jgi:hypothetical protein